MNHTFSVRGVKPVRNLDSQIQNGFDLHRPTTEAVLRRHAVQKLHGDEDLPVLFPDLVNGADVGVI